MRAGLDDSSIVHDEDLIRVFRGVDAVGDDDFRGPFRFRLEPLANREVGLGVDRGKGGVKDDDRGGGKQGAGDGDPLSLSPGKRDAFLPDGSFISLVEMEDRVVDFRGPRRLLDGSVRRLGDGDADVVFDGTREEEGILKDARDVLAQDALGLGLGIDSVEENRSARCFIETGEQGVKRALPRPRFSHDRAGRAGRDVERHVANDVIVGVVRIMEGDVLENDVAFQRGFVPFLDIFERGAQKQLDAVTRGHDLPEGGHGLGGIAQWPNHHVDESEGNRDAPTRNEALEAKGDGCNDRYSAREEDEDVAE